LENKETSDKRKPMSKFKELNSTNREETDAAILETIKEMHSTVSDVETNTPTPERIDALNAIKCNGHPPDLSHLDQETLKTLYTDCMANGSLNPIEFGAVPQPNHPYWDYSLDNQADKIKDGTVPDDPQLLRQGLYRMLEARGNVVSKATIKQIQDGLYTRGSTALSQYKASISNSIEDKQKEYSAIDASKGETDQDYTYQPSEAVQTAHKTLRQRIKTLDKEYAKETKKIGYTEKPKKKADEAMHQGGEAWKLVNQYCVEVDELTQTLKTKGGKAAGETIKRLQGLDTPTPLMEEDIRAIMRATRTANTMPTDQGLEEDLLSINKELDTVDPSKSKSKTPLVVGAILAVIAVGAIATAAVLFLGPAAVSMGVAAIIAGAGCAAGLAGAVAYKGISAHQDKPRTAEASPEQQAPAVPARQTDRPLSSLTKARPERTGEQGSPDAKVASLTPAQARAAEAARGV
jgi:hypothetical protein